MGRPARTEVPPARCGVHWPGHEVHAIQALRALNDMGNRGVAGEVIRIEGPRVDVQVGDAIREVWTHDAGRLAALVAAEGPAVVLWERWRLLCPAPAATADGAPGLGAAGAPGSAGKGRGPAGERTGTGTGRACVSVALSRDGFRPCPGVPPAGRDAVATILARGGGYLRPGAAGRG